VKLKPDETSLKDTNRADFTTEFGEKFDVLNDPNEIVINLKDSRVADHSAIEALHKIIECYSKVGKTVHLKHLSEDCPVCSTTLRRLSMLIIGKTLNTNSYPIRSDTIRRIVKKK